ncbi:hypothetical protein GDO86_015153 [Hymenochirus boettgeri]|uniref:Transmembrane protein 268 n=1 Tax=Hymenochirus boettgeri TaxID=247094 RepID=A0A8T2JX12_9PIPI|nr:hypothetical protein GDO86_015153 [Hymenochirus boettgeri]
MAYRDGDSDHRSELSVDSGESLHTGLYNGQLLSVLPYTSGVEQLEQCLWKLHNFGIQVPMEQCRDSLKCSVLIPELRRYIFFSSRVFGMVLALVLYISIWVNLYSTGQMFSGGQDWVASLPVTLIAAAVTAAVILVINRYNRKMNVNTDVRLAAANEIFMEHNILLGISDQSQGCYTVPSLCFIYFHLWGCQQRLSQHLESMPKDALRKCLDRLFIVIETPVIPLVGERGPSESVTEESPLLTVRPREKPVLYSKMVPLIVQCESQQEMAHQLLVVSSAYYVRLLTSDLLPCSSETRHIGVLDVPCLCQFIESSVLRSGCCFNWM